MAPMRCKLYNVLLVYGFLESLTWAETRDFLGRDLNFFTSTRVAGFPGSLIDYFKSAEIYQGNTITGFQSVCYRLDKLR